MGLRSAAAFILLLVPVAGTGTDTVDDELKAAKALAEAGKFERALAIADALAAVYAEDPRVHFYRSMYLRKLDRPNDAADALERAEATLDVWHSAGAPEDVAALSKAIRSEATELLKYRRLAAEVLRKYRERALEIARNLGNPPEEPFVLSILEEVYRVDPQHPEDLLPIWGRTSLESRSTHDERHGKFYAPPRPSTPANEARLGREMAEAEKLFQGGDYAGARSAALTALEIAPRAPRALVILAETLFKLDRAEESAYTAILAIDAPKTGDADAIRDLYDRASRQLHSPELRSFVRLKSAVAQDLLTLRDQARVDHRAFDEDWLERTAVRVAPGDPAVLGGVDRHRREEEAARNVSSLGKARAGLGDFNLLAVPELWRWENRTPGSDLTDDTLTLVPHDKNLMLKVYPRDIKVSKSFSLRFRLGYEVLPKQEPWLFFAFNADLRRSGNEENAVILFPENDHVVTFASRRPREIWAFRDRQFLPPLQARGSTWSLIEISWRDATKKLKLTVDGKKVLDRMLDEEDALDGRWYLGLGGSAVKVQLREFFVRNQD
jgi:tetratricopeptide (TPR) repeat protein